MHIPDGIVDNATTLTGTWLGSAGAVGYAIRWVRIRLSEGRVVLMAVLSALIFALQMLNFPVAGGTSGHFAGAAAAAILLGPWPAVVVMATVLLVQAVFFLDGGIVALGPNVFNLAVVTTFTGWWTYLAVTRFVRGRRGRLAGAFAAGWVSILCGASAAAIEIAASGKAPLALALGSMAFWHALIGIGEGLITAGLVGYLLAVRPDIFARQENEAPVGRVAAGLAALAIVAASLSFLASAFPDGLEHVLAGAGVEVPAGGARIPFALADYTIPGLGGSPALATVLAALVGSVLTGVALWMLLRAVRRTGHGQGAAELAPASGIPAAHEATADAARGFHRHPHSHDEDPAHVHPHHHVGAARADAPAHAHTHGVFFERHTYVVSPIHALDPRAKVVAATVLVVAIVLSRPLWPAEFVALVLFYAAVTLLARLPLGAILLRTAIVLPFAGVIALFAPLAQSGGSLSAGGLAGSYAHGGWIAAYAVISKAWLSAWAVVLLTATTPVPRLFKGLKALHAPEVVLTMLSFLYRYVTAMGEQLGSLRNALESRGFGLTRAGRVRLYGHLAGNLFVRAVERGERVHAAMMSRGYDGTIPSAEELTLRPADALMFFTVLAAAAALVVY